MLKRKTVSFIGSLGFAIVAASAAGSASASTLSCTGDYSLLAGDVTNSTNCLLLAPPNGQVNESVNPPQDSYTVNLEKFFGINTWSFDGKSDPVGSTSTSLVTFSGDATSGSYTINSGAGTYNELMFVFKDGNDTNLVAYLIDIGAGGGTYTTPFTDPPFALSGDSLSHNISHISVYYTTDPGGPGNGIPEPGTVALLGIGLLGAAVKRARAQRV